MPGRPHHSAKMKRCVDDVMAKGHSESSAYAICTTSLQNAGEAVYAEAHVDEPITVLESSEPRALHLLGATGQVRYEDLNGRRHLVVPVVALMEGVIHPVNAETPEFVSEAVLRKAAASWVGKPVTLGHPKKNGTQCSAGDAEVRKAAGVGVIMKSDLAGKKLLQEAWIDEEKAKALHPEMYEHLAAGGREEVSVGAFVVAAPRDSAFNGKKYKAEWQEAQGDHLAFLPGGRGACSCEMGCGTHRAAMHFVAAESIELLPRMPVETFTTLEGLPLDQRMQAVYQAVSEKWQTTVQQTMPDAYPLQVFDDRVIVRRGDETYSVDYTIDKDGKVSLGNSVKVRQQWVEAAAQKACEACGGTGQIKTDGKQADCSACDGEGYLKVAAGARHSASDTQMIQAMHDHSVALGATCDRKNFKTAADVNLLIDGKLVAKVASGQMIAMEQSPAIQPERIRREGTKWALYSAVDASRVLAYHNTEAEAREHEQALLAKCG